MKSHFNRSFQRKNFATPNYLRLGHNSSSRLEERLEADVQVQAILEAIQQCQLIDQDGPQGKPAGVDPALGRHLAVTVKDALLARNTVLSIAAARPQVAHG